LCHTISYTSVQQVETSEQRLGFEQWFISKFETCLLKLFKISFEQLSILKMCLRRGSDV
jgi:hypothetical protein